MGARNAGNPHAACDVEGAGDVVRSKRLDQAGAPVLDPTTEEAVAAWHAPATGARGGQPIYSVIAIETSLALRLVFHQPLRQTEGLLRSIADVLGRHSGSHDAQPTGRWSDNIAEAHRPQ